MLKPEQVARHILSLSSQMGEGQCGAMRDLSDGRLIGHMPDAGNPGAAFEESWQAAREQLDL